MIRKVLIVLVLLSSGKTVPKADTPSAWYTPLNRYTLQSIRYREVSPRDTKRDTLGREALAEVSFGEWLRRQRKATGLTQKQLALQISCSTSALKKIEAEERRPSEEIVGRIAEIFNIPETERVSFLRFARGDWKLAKFAAIEEAPWRASVKLVRSKLPVTPSSLIGREKPIADVREYLIQAEIHLVTLMGPPGIGKTRLSIESARQSLDHFPDGVFFVALAPLEDPSLIALTIIQALGYVEAKNVSARQQLLEGIGDKQVLLVLDNCEHLIDDVASLVSDLLSTCPRLKILTTSRESLRVTGEWLYHVPTLKVPKESSPIEIETISEFSALTLFAERAHAVHSDFALNSENVQDVASICTQLDGLPLAIELIAARMRLMSPQSLLKRWNDQLVLSADGMRATSTRQKTLNNAIGWSYKLLSTEEQKLFAYLSVFSGGLTLEAAESMFSEVFPIKSVPDLIISLLDKSLLQHVHRGQDEPRFTMLVTIQEFARTCLREIGEEAEARKWHRAYFLDLAEQANREIHGPAQGSWMGRLDAELDNFRATLDWSLQQGDAPTALRLANLLLYFWDIRNYWMEGRSWIERALTLAHFEDHALEPHKIALWAQALLGQGRLAFIQGDLSAARTYLEKSTALYGDLARIRMLDDEKSNHAQALNYLGFTAMQECEYLPARARFEEALSLYRELEPTPGSGVGFTLTLLGGVALWQGEYERAMRLGEESQRIGSQLRHIHLISSALDLKGRALYHQGDFERGRRLLEDSLALTKQLGNHQGFIDTLDRLGLIAYYEGDYRRATDLLEAALALSQALKYKIDRAVVQSTYAAVALAEENPARARALLVESLPSLQEAGMKWFIIRGLEIMAAVEVAEFHATRAAHLFGVTSSAREALGAPLPPPERAAYERAVQTARGQLDEDAFAIAWAEGRALTLDQAIEYVLEESRG